MKYIFETEYNLRGLTAMAKALRKTVRKKRSKRSHFLGWIIVALSLLLVFASKESHLTSKEIVTLIAGAAIVITFIFEDKLNGHIAQKRMLKGTEKSTAVFDEENTETFVSQTQAGKTEFYYKNIVAVAETKEYFVFLLSANHAQLYDKAGLTGGTIEEFKIFINETTGKPVVYIK